MSHNGRALILPATLCLASACFLSCEKPSQKEPEKEIVEEVVSEAPPKSEFPFFHTLTDSQGRSIRAEVLGRDAYTVTIVRTRDKKRFTLSLDGLAPVDETFLRQLPITEPRPEDPVTVESPSYQRESKRKAIEEKKPTGYEKLLLGRLEERNKEIKDLREELSDMDPNTIRSKSLSERIQKLTAEMAEINRLIDEID